MSKKFDISVVLPTYNERENIIILIQKIFAITKSEKLSVQCVIVDDNSTDGTKEALRKYIRTNVSLYIRKKERGLATAILYGIEKTSGEIIIVMDTDLNHDPALIPKLLKPLKEKSMVVGSRFIRGGGMDNYLRYICSKFYNEYFLSLILGSGIHDNLSGYYAIYRKDLIQYARRDIFSGYGDYFIRLIYSLKRDSFHISEIPCYYKDRQYGTSKSRFVHMLLSYSWEAIKYVFAKKIS